MTDPSIPRYGDLTSTMAHAHDATPPLPEPHTPLGFTLLGIALLLFGAVYWVARGTGDEAVAAETSEAAE